MHRSLALVALLAFAPACRTQPLSIDSSDLAPGAQDGGADLRAPIDLASAPDAGGVDEVPCAQSTCSTKNGGVCCENVGGGTCQQSPCPANSFVTLACDGPEDCHGLACCYDNTVNVIQCEPDCGSNFRICHSKADCQPGECCLQLEASAPVSGCLATTGC
ncbi:MAG TPA: hypothetical protein VFF06_23700 [Polyangia bacterium]|nr:hypothetical protein [Polyangia bacterium]